jgi:bacterioferritin-associated ferredoxin
MSTSDEINIDRCYCEQMTFVQLLALARREGLGVAGLAALTGCGTHCGWCVAYLGRALQTGDVVFHELLPKEEITPAPGD